MKDDRRILLARFLFVLCLAGATANALVWAFTQSGRLSPGAALAELAELVSWSVLALVLSLLAQLIITRQPGNAVGWLLLISAGAMANPIEALLQVRLGPPNRLTPMIWFLLWVDIWSWIPAILPFFLVPLYFPTGRPPSPRWNWVSRLAAALWVIFMVFAAIQTDIGPLNADWLVPNPIGFIPTGGPSVIWLFWGAGLLAVLSGSVISLGVRFRQARAGERQQIKGLLYVGTIFAIVYGINYYLNDLDVSPLLTLLTGITFFLSILSFPVAITVAILRHRLYDIDLIIRKTLIYGVLSGLLGLVYLGIVVIAQGVFDVFTGQQSQIAIVLSTLVIAALFAPLRLRVQNVIDRRFYRRKIDAQRVLARFGRTARDEVSLDALANELTHVVAETLQPELATLWLKGVEPARDDRFDRPEY